MDIGRAQVPSGSRRRFEIPEEVVQDRRARNLCIKCGGTNHFARNCSARAPVLPSARAAVASATATPEAIETIAETEEGF